MFGIRWVVLCLFQQRWVLAKRSMSPSGQKRRDRSGNTKRLGQRLPTRSPSSISGFSISTVSSQYFSVVQLRIISSPETVGSPGTGGTPEKLNSVAIATAFPVVVTQTEGVGWISLSLSEIQPWSSGSVTPRNTSDRAPSNRGTPHRRQPSDPLIDHPRSSVSTWR